MTNILGKRVASTSDISGWQSVEHGGCYPHDGWHVYSGFPRYVYRRTWLQHQDLRWLSPKDDDDDKFALRAKLTEVCGLNKRMSCRPPLPISLRIRCPIPQGHTASVLSVAFVSAGTQLVSGGADGLLKVWTVRSDECEATLDAHTDKVWALTTARAPPKRSRPVAVTRTDAEQMEEEMEGHEEEGVGPNRGLVVVSGGADSVINVWKDVTAREEVRVCVARGEGGGTLCSYFR